MGEKKNGNFVSHIIFKMIQNSVSLLLGFVSVSVVPRALGVVMYGHIGFVREFFERVLQASELGIGSGLYILHSQNPKDRIYLRIMLVLVALIGTGIIASTAIASRTFLSSILWPEVPRHILLLGSLAFVFAWAAAKFKSLLDARRRTGITALFGMGSQILVVAVVLYLSARSQLSPRRYLVVTVIAAAVSVLGVVAILLAEEDTTFEQSQTSQTVKRIFRFAAPLAVLIVLGTLTILIDRWLLQTFAGSEQQGFYTLSRNISQVVFIISSAVIPIYQREAAMYAKTADDERQRRFFLQAQAVLLVVTSYFSVFVAINASFIIPRLVGEAYSGAGSSVALMALYPIYQSVGQVNGSFFLSSMRTKQYRNISVAISLVSMTITYFVLAPPNMGGLGAVASGLAAKNVLFQFLSVNFLLFLNTRHLSLGFIQTAVSQISIVAAFAGFAFMLRATTVMFLHESILTFVVTGAVYSVFCALFLYKFSARLNLPALSALRKALRPDN